jgi:hypothetical protein
MNCVDLTGELHFVLVILLKSYSYCQWNLSLSDLITVLNLPNYCGLS